MDDHDERIRKRVHEIWEEEGRPEGREYSHWLRAKADLHAEESEKPARPDRTLNRLGLHIGRIQPA